MGLVVSSCLQMSLADKVAAQGVTDLDLDRATVKSVVNLNRYMPLPSDMDLEQGQSPTQDQNRASGQSPTQSIDPGLVQSSQTDNTGVLKNPFPSGPGFIPLRNTTSSGVVFAPDGKSDVLPNVSNVATPVNNDGRAIAQAQPNIPTPPLPIDLTPARLPERNSNFNGLDAYRTRMLYWLPSKFFCDFSVENSLRFELNTFQTNRHYLSDLVYRVLPNITLGYALTKRTRIGANYFFLRDQYDKRNKQLSRNFQSIGARIDHDIKIDEKTTFTAGFMPRVLFINTSHQPAVVYNDLLPSGVITRQIKNGVIYGSVIGQIRFRDILAKFQEGDQFYSLGASRRVGRNWTLLADSTLVTNFGNHNLRQGPNNQNIIMTFEAGRRILPYVTAFARAQPIFNIGANHSPGYAGFNFRIFGGLRAEIGRGPIFPIKLKG